MRILFSAGDVSGDTHCALLMREIRRRHPSWKFAVIGGAQMQKLADETIIDTRGLAVIGVVSSLLLTSRFFRLIGVARRWAQTENFDAAVVCDWGAFHSRLLPHLKKRNIPALYYFPPRSWRKSGAGASALAPLVNCFATPFPWDAERLKRNGARAEWVGHPLLEIVKGCASREELRKEFGVETNQKLVAILPGSRALELKYIAPSLAGAAKQLQSTVEFGCPPHGEAKSGRADTRFVVATPHGVTLPPAFDNIKNLVHAPGRATEALRACDAAMVKSGTATLEAAACDAPQVVVYDGPVAMSAQFLLMSARQKITFVAMPNIIAEKQIVPELLMPKCRPQFIAEEIQKLLQSGTAMRENYVAVRQALGEDLPIGATARTADLLEELL